VPLIIFFALTRNIAKLTSWTYPTHPRLQAAAAILMRSVLFCTITQRRVIILYRCFGITYRSHPQGSRGPRRVDFLSLEDGTDTLSRNVGKRLPLDAALYPRRAQILLHLCFEPHNYWTRVGGRGMTDLQIRGRGVGG
jgi:hypothetical protein